MKNTIYLLFLSFWIGFSGCEKSEDAVHLLGSVEGATYKIMEFETAVIPNGVYQTRLDDFNVKVVVEEHTMKWLMPNVKEGSHTLKIEAEDLTYHLNIQVFKEEVIEFPKTYLQELIKTKDFGLSEDYINSLPVDTQQELALFLKVNENAMDKGLEKQRAIENERNVTTATLAVGQSVTFNAWANRWWNNSGIHVSAGEVYQVTAIGQWTDLFTTTDANGYDDWFLDLFGFLRRVPNHSWFKLIGSVKQVNYPVGVFGTISPVQSGRLDFYANDVLIMYWNNTGKVTVTVTRIF